MKIVSDEIKKADEQIAVLDDAPARFHALRAQSAALLRAARRR